MRQSALEMWDAGLYGCRAVACEVLAKRMSVAVSFCLGVSCLALPCLAAVIEGLRGKL